MTDHSCPSARARRKGLRLRARWRLALSGRWALPVLFAGSVLESSVLPWPIEFPMLAYMLRGRRHTVIVTAVVSAGSVTGCLLMYLAGIAAIGSLEGFIETRPGLAESVAIAKARMETSGPIAVFVAMLAPVPVQVASFAAGATGMAVAPFLIAAATGRTLRYAAMGVLVYGFGPAVLGQWARVPDPVRRVVRYGLALAFLALLVWTLSAVFSAH